VVKISGEATTLKIKPRFFLYKERSGAFVIYSANGIIDFFFLNCKN